MMYIDKVFGLSFSVYKEWCDSNVHVAQYNQVNRLMQSHCCFSIKHWRYFSSA